MPLNLSASLPKFLSNWSTTFVVSPEAIFSNKVFADSPSGPSSKAKAEPEIIKPKKQNIHHFIFSSPFWTPKYAVYYPRTLRRSFSEIIITHSPNNHAFKAKPDFKGDHFYNILSKQ